MPVPLPLSPSPYLAFYLDWSTSTRGLRVHPHSPTPAVLASCQSNARFLLASLDAERNRKAKCSAAEATCRALGGIGRCLMRVRIGPVFDLGMSRSPFRKQWREYIQERYAQWTCISNQACALATRAFHVCIFGSAKRTIIAALPFDSAEALFGLTPLISGLGRIRAPEVHRLAVSPHGQLCGAHLPCAQPHLCA